MKKVNKIHQIVRLRQFVQKWHAKAEARQERSGGTIGCSLSPRFKHRSPFVYDSDDEACYRMRPVSPPPDVPKGCLAVYVGRERRRFIIPMSYLSRPAFRTLLDKAEEEFGFDHKGGLTIPCEVTVFRHVLRVLEGNDPAGQNLSLDELLKFYSAERDCGSQALNSTITLESFPVAAAAVQYNFGLRKLL